MTNWYFNFNRRPRGATSYAQAKQKSKTKFIYSLIVFTILLLAFWYVVHPAINWHSPLNFINIFALCIYLLVSFSSAMYYRIISIKGYQKFLKYYLSAIGIFIVFVIVLGVITSPVFNAKEYASRITIDTTEFSVIDEVDFSKTPIIDRESTIALGDRVMGQMPELVSQFEVSEEYTQISYRDSVYRVTPLEYADTIKYFTNRNEGIPAYILVNSTTGEAELVKLSDLGLKGMRYVPSAMFNENLMRKLQLTYPTEIFGQPSFEIDEEGHPWYICTTYTYKGIGNKLAVDGVVLFDPITGESTNYDNVLDAPTWIDRIYPEILITEEINNYGSLKDGFINSVLGQKNVFATSAGYNYLEKDGDIWIYSGITSVNSDSANLGFVLANLRTHEAMRINSAGADERSAMNSAEGEVKNYGYYSTFPLLVSVQGKPVYLVALKDNAGLIKMYAMVDAVDYQKVVTVNVDEGLEALRKKFINASGSATIEVNETKTKTIIVKDVQFFMVNNETRAYITDVQDQRYKMTLTNDNENALAFIKPQDVIKITYQPQDDVSIIKSIE
ncbi:MAG: hypothetical protein MR210_04925 [Erysipelotrichaceae bacterium]|nr:hypothetical protein [Erysipelotrichaceae bacterium]MDY5252901.1 hypothetical protein [Erysipelotrichaceae bacterium]